MSELITGICLASLAIVPAAVALFRRKTRQVRDEQARRTDVEEELTRLTGELAHEIRNPLSTIKVNLKLTEEALTDASPAEPDNEPSDPRRQKLASALRKITIIRKETDRLEQILDGFLRYVRRPDLQLATLDLNELVSDMIDFYSPQAHSHKLTVRQGFAPESLMCRVDPGALKQVLLNLFINAQQAMDREGELMIRTIRRDSRAIVQISDTGRGIPPEKVPAIFQPFSSGRSGGTGLGLATAKKIIEAHNGVITVHSEPGKGTSFTIDLPLMAGDSGAGEAR
jgi:two-component system sensor histidine kinase HydH